MSSKVDICNMALIRLGANTITSLTDNTVEAKLCKGLFDTLAARVMMQGSWTSTIKRATLALLDDVPAFGYSHTFQLPTDPKCLKILNVDECRPGSTDFRKEGDKLLACSSIIKIRYVSLLTETEDWDPLLTEAFETILASYLAGPITGKADLAQALKKEYLDLVNLNLALDGQQGSKDYLSVTDLTEVR